MHHSLKSRLTAVLLIAATVAPATCVLAWNILDATRYATQHCGWINDNNRNYYEEVYHCWGSGWDNSCCDCMAYWGRSYNNPCYVGDRPDSLCQEYYDDNGTWRSTCWQDGNTDCANFASQIAQAGCANTCYQVVGCVGSVENPFGCSSEFFCCWNRRGVMVSAANWRDYYFTNPSQWVLVCNFNNWNHPYTPQEGDFAFVNTPANHVVYMYNSTNYLAHTKDRCTCNMISVTGSGISYQRVYRRIESQSYDPLQALDRHVRRVNHMLIPGQRQYQHRTLVNVGVQR